MKEFTKEMLQTLIEADKKVCGTVKYTKYWMQMDGKTNGRWSFIINTIPHTTGYFKTFRGKTYIITKGHFCDEHRFHVNDAVKELLNI